MKEYIERAPLLERLSKVKMDEHGFGLAVQFGIDHAINCIKEAPAAGVAEVRHGRWENNGQDDIVVYCSQCMMPQDAPSNYCSSCGALMDKEDEHEAG